MSHHHRQRACHHRRRCAPGIGLEIWPASAEAYFSDEAYVDPVNTQIRFDATIFNAPMGHLKWSIQAIHGGPGAGAIDSTGLYTAPLFDPALAGAGTEVIVATSTDDPFIRAFAFVTLLGRGPAPAAVPTIEVLPKLANLYYSQSRDPVSNHFFKQYMDSSNSEQVFRTLVREAQAPSLTWKVNGTTVHSGTDPFWVYQAPVNGPNDVKTLTVEFTNDSTVNSESKICLLNYYWPNQMQFV